MFSPEAWFTIASNFQSANVWFNWTLFILGLLATGWIVHDLTDLDDEDTHWGAIFDGVTWSAVMAIAWPLAIGAIPILLGVGLIVVVVMLPKWIRVWLHVRKVKKAALKAMSESVDKS